MRLDTHPAARIFSIRYFRIPRFLQDLRLAHADGSFPKLLAALARFDLIIFDDWMRDALSLVQSQDLLDILDDRYGRTSTMVVTQILIDAWYERISDPTLADAILDRLVIMLTASNYRVNLKEDFVLLKPWRPLDL